MKIDDRRQLPPISMLQCLEAAARLGSFSRAGEALNLTQSAISRHIANLEQWLGARLFDRAGRRIRLNDTGRAYLDEIAPALAAIRRATARLIDPPAEHVIELAVLPSFGMRWLAPRLPSLTQKHPDLVVNIAARADIFSFSAERFDAAIHVGDPDWPGASHDFLFYERVLPVVSPKLLEETPINGPADLLRLPLLVQSQRRDAWSRWFGMFGLAVEPSRHLPSISHFLMLAQTIAAGGGAALIPSFLIAPELDSGQLVIPIDAPLQEERSYWLASPEDQRHAKAFTLFRDWIKAECPGEV